jgi:hypothetical protein
MTPPAYRLEGLELDGGWTVGARLEPGPHATGGNFSCGYPILGKDGKRAFLKALDFSPALGAPDPARALQSLTEAYNFERNLLEMCTARRMDRVVQAISDGKVKVDDTALGTVQYLILECGDCDIRTQLSLVSRIETAWKLRSLHHIATGLGQLHSSSIAHQDLKPSNVVVFAGAESKISDLGCASLRGSTGPRDHLSFAGDAAYAPLETLYGYVDPEWNLRRLGCDLYLLGSMVVFFFTGLTTTALVSIYLNPGHHWRKWDGTYADVLPYLREAFRRAMESFGDHIVNSRLREELKLIVRQLCDPDPKLRGHPLNRRGVSNPAGVERYVSSFDLLAWKAELGIFKV